MSVKDNFNILVVEDSTNLNSLIVESLRNLGYKAEGAFIGADALNLIAKNNYFAVLLDHELPDMTGRDVINATAKAERKVPFVVITGKGNEQLATELMKLGAVDYLVKDSNFIELLPGVLDKVLKKHENEQHLIRAQAKLEQQITDNQFIANLSLQLADTNGKDIVKDIALPNIKKRTGAIYAHFTTYNPQNKSFSISCIESESNLIQSIVSVGGQKIFSNDYTVSDSLYQKLCENNYLKSNSLYELTGGALSESVSKALKKVVGFKLLISIPQIHNGKLYGETTLAFSENQVLPSEELIVSFSNILAVSLRNSINESQIKINEEKYRLLVENTHSIAWEYDILSDRWVYVAPQCMSILGYEPNEWIDLEFWTSRLHPDDREWASHYCMECTAKGENHTFEYRFRKKDDDFAWLRDIVSVEMKDDKPVKLRGLIIDITKRKQAENELLKTKLFLEKLLNTTPIPIFYKDNKGRYTGLNNSFEGFFGKSREELIGKTVFDINPPELASIYHEKDAELFNNIGTQIYDSKVKTAAGEIRDVVFHKASLFDNAGCITGLVGGILDITERKQAEQALKYSEEHTQLLNKFLSELLELQDSKSIYAYIANSIQRYIGDSVVLCISVDEKKNETVLESIAGVNNSLIEKISKLAGFNLLGKRYELKKNHLKYFRKGDLVEFNGNLAEFSADQFPPKLAKLAEKLIGLNSIYTHGIARDSKVLAAVHILTLNSKTITNPLFISSCIQQAALVLQKKTAEEKLFKNENSLRLMNDEKDAFFQILAHDLRSPLGAIMGTSELLCEKHNAYSPEKRQLFIDQLFTLATNTFNLLDELLLWSNSQAGNLSFKPQKVNLGNETSDLIESVKPLAASKEISIGISIEKDIVVLADKNMLSVILRNLVVNAIKFTNNGGHIQIDSTIDSKKVIISVSDNGVGMDKETIDSIFKLDKKTTTTGTNNELGTGLGLKLCKEFVEKNGGKIWAESEVGKGSVIKFSLPLWNERKM